MLLYPLTLRGLGAVLRASLLPLPDAGTIERATDGVVADSGQILHAPAADEHHGVLLQVMALAADVAGDFIAVGESHAAHLAERGIGLLRRRGIDARAHPALLRRRAERRNLGFFHPRPARLPDELTRGRHRLPYSPALTAAVSATCADATYEKHRAAFVGRAGTRKSLFSVPACR